MNILVTGAKGFVGRNLCETLKNIRDGKDKTRDIDSNLYIFEYDIDSHPALLDEYCSKCDFVFHLAGVNRPEEESEFMKGNFGFTSTLLDSLKKQHNIAPVMISSSIQAELDNPYGISKKAGEELLFEYSKETGAKVLVYRFPNLFGKWCRPNYNSVVATFCCNIASGSDIKINNPSVELSLSYIDDVIDELIDALKNKEHVKNNYCYVPVTYKVTLGKVVELLYSFKESRSDKSVPDFSDSFTNKLYATYLSYLPKDKFSYPLKMNIDDRGSFTEILRTIDRGQFSVNVSKPGITKGQHWHHTKNEKFVVVSGSGLIQFRKIGSDEIIDYHVTGDKIEVVDIPTGYTHNIINEGKTDLVTFMWANECFNPKKPDTFFEEV
jgi:UDP-2-acetamido-2,6-beta-L-arabino-hexul-4-ose reductase